MTVVDPHLDAALAAHDRGVADAGLDIWVGAEPTFTLRHSESPEWLSEPLGGDKFAYALRMAAALQRRHPGSVVLRSVGRQYAAEKVPRWSVGLLERRDHSPLWGGPPDPFDGSAAVHEDQLDTLWEALAQEFGRRGLACMRLRIADPLGRRLLAGTNVTALDLAADDPRLARPSVHAHKTPPEGLSDPLAADGRFLFSIGSLGVGQATVSACIELPACPDVPTFLGWLAAIQDAANLAGLDALVVQGFPPPVDASLAWTTITPDPAVVEVNQAPQPDVGQFLAAMRELFEVAQQLGLSPYRLQYNGTMSDSGGGGQFTLGGPSAAASPFFVQPALLPRLVRYFNRHPALSYLFAPDYVGSASQSPRADEGTRDAFRELHVALGQLQRRARPTAEFLWASLAPFLADPSGNAHRSELNIEKLCNPYLPGRGRLGLVEFRAFRMPVSPQRAAAVAALLRAIATMLCAADPVPGLRDWGDALHDQYALPFFLRQDLRSVFRDLETQGPGLDASVQHVLLDDAFRPRWTTRFEGCELTIERAVEFWPLVGDVASQEGGGSRMVDSSTTRLQLCLRSCAADGPALHDWRVQIAGIGVPLRAEQDENGAARLIGVRYRDFVPWRGLHPAIGPLGPLHLTLSHPELSAALAMTLHNWHPEGQPYDGLPATPEAAAERLAERLVVRRIAGSAIAVDRPAPEQALSAYTLDLRLCDLAAD